VWPRTYVWRRISVNARNVSAGRSAGAGVSRADSSSECRRRSRRGRVRAQERAIAARVLPKRGRLGLRQRRRDVRATEDARAAENARAAADARECARCAPDDEATLVRREGAAWPRV
jgi:hypothetical protein